MWDKPAVRREGVGESGRAEGEVPRRSPALSAGVIAGRLRPAARWSVAWPAKGGTGQVSSWQAQTGKLQLNGKIALPPTGLMRRQPDCSLIRQGVNCLPVTGCSSVLGQAHPPHCVIASEAKSLLLLPRSAGLLHPLVGHLALCSARQSPPTRAFARKVNYARPSPCPYCHASRFTRHASRFTLHVLRLTSYVPSAALSRSPSTCLCQRLSAVSISVTPSGGGR